MSTHNRGWVGFDLDGTLAHYDGFVAPDHIGAAIPGMVELAKSMIASGVEVRILTARANRELFKGQAEVAIEAIEAWCQQHLGRIVRITCSKDQEMVALYDDRAIQVLPNKGVSIGACIIQLKEDIVKATEKQEIITLVTNLIRNITNNS